MDKRPARPWSPSASPGVNRRRPARRPQNASRFEAIVERFLDVSSRWFECDQRDFRLGDWPLS